MPVSTLGEDGHLVRQLAELAPCRPEQAQPSAAGSRVDAGQGWIGRRARCVLRDSVLSPRSPVPRVGHVLDTKTLPELQANQDFPQAPWWHIAIEASDEASVQQSPDLITRVTCPRCSWTDGGDDFDYGEICYGWWKDPEAYRWLCPACATRWQVHELDWSHTVGFYDFAIRLWGLCYAIEPTQQLLAILKQTTGADWTWTHCRI